MKHRPTTPDGLRQGLLPTLECTTADLEAEIPSLYLEGMQKIFHQLSLLEKKPIPGEALLYALDGKFYEPEIPLSSSFESAVEGVFFIGDCSGITASLSQAAANGIFLANHFAKSIP